MHICVYCHTLVNVYVYIYIYIGGWGAETNREIVSFRSCVRAQLYVRSEWISKMITDPFSLFAVRCFPFSLGRSGVPFPLK